MVCIECVCVLEGEREREREIVAILMSFHVYIFNELVMKAKSNVESQYIGAMHAYIIEEPRTRVGQPKMKYWKLHELYKK